MALMINKTNKIIALAVTILCVITSVQGATKKVYRYTNSNGVQVINDKIPPEYVDKGYEVITYQGEVVTIVPPQKTDEEIKKAKVEQERLRKAQAEKDRLREWDERLLLRYSHVDEINQAKMRALNVIDIAIMLNNNNLKRLKTDIEQQQVEAAEIERKGEELSEGRKATLIAFKNELQLVIDSISRRKVEKITVATEYNADVERFSMLKERLEAHQKKLQAEAS